MTALLLALGAKKTVLRDDIPQYAGTVVNELWKRKDGYYVKVNRKIMHWFAEVREPTFFQFLYLDNSTSPARTITGLLDACPDNEELCSLQTFLDGSNKMSTKDETVGVNITIFRAFSAH